MSISVVPGLVPDSKKRKRHNGEPDNNDADAAERIFALREARRRRQEETRTREQAPPSPNEVRIYFFYKRWFSIGSPGIPPCGHRRPPEIKRVGTRTRATRMLTHAKSRSHAADRVSVTVRGNPVTTAVRSRVFRAQIVKTVRTKIRYLVRPSPLACWPYYYRTVLVVFHAVFCSPEDTTHRGTDSKMPSWPTGNTRGNSRKKSAVYRVVNTMHNVTYSFRST